MSTSTSSIRVTLLACALMAASSAIAQDSGNSAKKDPKQQAVLRQAQIFLRDLQDGKSANKDFDWLRELEKNPIIQERVFNLAMDLVTPTSDEGKRAKRQLLRRARGFERSVEFGDVVIDLRNRQVTRDGEPVALSRKELEVLLCLARKRGRIVARDDLLAEVWGYHPSSGARAVDFHILNLRRKLEHDPAAPRFLITHHGVGYQLVD